MSYKVAGRVWDLAIPQCEAWVLMSLADHAEHDGSNVYPSVALTAWKTGYSERQIQRIIHKLIERKILIPEETNRGVGKPNKYYIDFQVAPLKPEMRRAKRKGDMGDIRQPMGDISAAQTPANGSDGCHKDVTQLSNQVTEPSKEPSIPAIAVPSVPPEVSPPEVSVHRRFTDSWSSAYLDRFKSKYFFNGAKDGSAVSRLLAAGENVDALMSTVKRAWAELGTGFLYQQSTTIAGFASKLNEIRAVLANPGSATQKPAWMEIRDLEQERKPLAATLEEFNELLRHDSHRTQENIDIRKNARERVEAIDKRLGELRAK